MSYKYRPKRVYKNEKGLYYIVQKKKRYIKLDKNIDEKKLININIKNVLGYVKRKNITKKKNKVNNISNPKGQTQIEHDIKKSSSFLDNKMFLYSGANNLLFNKQFLPQLSYLQPPTNSNTKDLTLLIQGLLETNKTTNNELKDLISNKVSNVPKMLENKKNSPLKIALKPSLSPETPAPLLKSKIIRPTPTPTKPSSVVEINDVGTSNNSSLKTLDDLSHKELKSLAVKIKAEGAPEKTSVLKTPSLYNVSQMQSLKNAIKNTGFLDNYDPETLNDVLNQLGSGSYTNDDDGLYNDEISNIVKKRIPNYFIPVIPADEIPSLLPYINSNTNKFGFIMNLDNHNEKGSHWIAVFISRADMSVEYYDSFGDSPSTQFLRDIKPLIEKMNDNLYYILKINRIKDQSIDSQNCGYFAIHFLDNRFAGKPWKEATFFDKVIDKSKTSEKSIERYKNYL